MPRPEPQPCGTWGAYQAHRRNGDPVDDACREACRIRSAEYRASNLERSRKDERERKRRSRAKAKEAAS
jgi:hypothetical protein